MCEKAEVLFIREMVNKNLESKLSPQLKRKYRVIESKKFIIDLLGKLGFIDSKKIYNDLYTAKNNHIKNIRTLLDNFAFIEKARVMNSLWNGEISSLSLDITIEKRKDCHVYFSIPTDGIENKTIDSFEKRVKDVIADLLRLKVENVIVEHIKNEPFKKESLRDEDF